MRSACICLLFLNNVLICHFECNLFLFADGYTVNDIQYIWKHGQDKSVEVYEGLTISQFNIRGIQTKNLTKVDHNGNHIIFINDFHLDRHCVTAYSH